MKMSENKNESLSEARISSKIIKNSLSSSMKNHKALWVIGIILIVVVALLCTGAALLKNENFIASIVTVIIPDHIENANNDDLDIVFYKELNQEYIDSTTKFDDEDYYINMFNYYYVDDYGEKHYLPDGIYHYWVAGEEQTVAVALGFFYAAGERLDNIKTAITAMIWIIVIAVVIAGIIIWYKHDKAKTKVQPRRKKKNN